MEKRQEAQKDSQKRGTVVEGLREELYNGQMRDKRFGVEGGRECSISRGGPDSTVEIYMSEEGVTVLRHRGQLQE